MNITTTAIAIWLFQAFQKLLAMQMEEIIKIGQVAKVLYCR